MTPSVRAAPGVTLRAPSATAISNDGALTVSTVALATGVLLPVHDAVDVTVATLWSAACEPTVAVTELTVTESPAAMLPTDTLALLSVRAALSETKVSTTLRAMLLPMLTTLILRGTEAPAVTCVVGVTDVTMT